MPPSPRPIAVPLICAVGYAGGVVAYLPLLTLLLPIRVEQIAGEARFGVLAATLIAGALVAGASGIVFGWLSDRSFRGGGGRRRWMAVGLAATLCADAVLTQARTPVEIVAAIMLFQAALNALLAPLVALIAEEVPDAQKGLVGGLLAGAQPVASLLCPLLVVLPVPGLGIRLVVIGVVATGFLLPLLLGRPHPVPVPAIGPFAGPPRDRRDLGFAWASRLLFQIAGNVLLAYLFYFMEGLAGSASPATVAVHVGNLLVLASLAPLPVSILIGRWSDRIGRRVPFLLAAAACAALGLVVMAAAGGWALAAAGFGLYSVGWVGFLSLQTGFVMQLLPDPDRRGRDLGIMNLANTIPLLVGPALTWLLATPRHLAPLLLTLAALTLAGGLTMLGVRERRRA